MRTDRFDRIAAGCIATACRNEDAWGGFNCSHDQNGFNVMSGTVIEKTLILLQKWFVAIVSVVKTKKSLSSYRLSHDLVLNQKSK